jgi:hypothetical protein
MLKTSNISEEKLLAETPLFFLFSLPLIMGGKPPHLLLEELQKDPDKQKYLKEYTKVSKQYLKILKTSLSDIGALNIVSNLIKDKFLSNILKEYIFLYITRGNHLDSLYKLIGQVTKELISRINNKLSFLQQLLEFVVIALSLFSLVVIISKITINYYYIFLLFISLNMFFTIIIPFSKIQIMEVYLEPQLNSKFHIDMLYLTLIMLEIFALIKDMNYLLIASFLLIFIINIISIKGLISSIKQIDNILYTIRIITDFLSVRAPSQQLMKILTNDQRVPRDIIYVMKGGISGKSITHSSLVAEIITSILSSGKKALAAMRIIGSILEAINAGMKRVVHSLLIQLTLLVGAVAAYEVAFKKVVEIFSAYGYSIDVFTYVPWSGVNIVYKAISISVGIVSMILCYIMLGRRGLSINFATPLLVFITKIIIS